MTMLDELNKPINFFDRDDCIVFSKHIDEYGNNTGVFLFKNFIDQKTVNEINNSIKYSPAELTTNLINWYEGKHVDGNEKIHEVWEKISDFLYPEWAIHPSNSLLAVKPGDGGMFVHSDSPGKGACHKLSNNDLWQTCCVIDYGIVVYFGEFEGGEIFYPLINPDGSIKNEDGGPCLEILPEPGDLVIHSSYFPYDHGVKEVTSGIRYAFSNFCLRASENPGTFWNYKTPEYFNQIGNKTQKEINMWLVPLKENPQFSEEKIKTYKASGLERNELAKKFFQNHE